MTGRILAILALVWSTAACGEDLSPLRTVEHLQRALSDLSDLDQQSYDQRFGALEPVITATHDLAHIHRVVAGRHWRDWSEEDRKTFGQRFSRLTVALYAARFHGFSEFRSTSQSELPRGVVQVEAVLVPASGDPVNFQYLLHRQGEQWLIVNVLVDGFSDLALRRSQVARLAGEGGLASVLAGLDRELQELTGGGNHP